MVKWSLRNSSRVDVGVSNFVQISRYQEKLYEQSFKADMTIKELLLHRYLISVQGNDVATNLKWALASNSVVLMPPPTRESFILESRLEAWKHYVPIKHDTSDLEEKVNYCEENVATCKKISQASTAWMMEFSSRRKIYHLGARVMEEHLRTMLDWT